ncbi:NfeD family protein [bacterium]|nr:NfeD family protein [bacterium]
MNEFLTSLSTLETLFLISAVLGGIAFLARMVMQFMGGADADADLDAGGLDHDFGSHEAAHHADSDTSFKILTIQGVTGFFMIFGLTGLAFMRATPVGWFFSTVIAFVAGYATLWILGWLTTVMLSLQSSGNVDLRNAIGQEATVYLKIPADGTGQATVCVQDRLRILDAVSQNHEEIPTGRRVQVVDVGEDNVLVVKKS